MPGIEMGDKSISLLLKFAEEQSYPIPHEVFSVRKSLPTKNVSQVKATQIVADPTMQQQLHKVLLEHCRPRF